MKIRPKLKNVILLSFKHGQKKLVNLAKLKIRIEINHKDKQRYRVKI